MAAMQRPSPRLQTQMSRFTRQDGGRKGFGEEKNIDDEDEAGEDDGEVHGPSPAEVGLGYAGADERAETGAAFVVGKRAEGLETRER